jgi:hypothetical protein
MLIAAAPTSPLVRSPMERRDCNRRIKVFSGLAKPAITPSDATIPRGRDTTRPRADQSDRLGQDQRRNGQPISLSA